MRHRGSATHTHNARLLFPWHPLGEFPEASSYSAPMLELKWKKRPQHRDSSIGFQLSSIANCTNGKNQQPWNIRFLWKKSYMLSWVQGDKERGENPLLAKLSHFSSVFWRLHKSSLHRKRFNFLLLVEFCIFFCTPAFLVMTVWSWYRW